MPRRNRAFTIRTTSFLILLSVTQCYQIPKPLAASLQPTFLEGPPRRLQQPAPIIPARAQQDIQITMENMRAMTRVEMVAMTSTGAVLLLGIIALLASSMETPSVEQAPMAAFEEVVANVVDAAVPLTATDVVSVSMGEGLAGLLSAGFTYLLSQLRTVAMQQLLTQNRKRSSPTTVTTPPSQVTPTFSDAVADGDFLLTRAAATPFLAAAGVSPVLAATLSAAFAIVPSESIRLKARARQRRLEEDQLLQEMLQQQLEEQKQNASILQKVQNVIQIRDPSQQQQIVDPDSLKPIVSEKSAKGLNFVEIFCDITRWLEYSVLMNDYKGMFPFLDPAMESAVFGALASLSALLYADVFNAYFGLGGSEVRRALEQRTVEDWSSAYLTRMFYGAVLFGVYEGAQGPVTELVESFLSGGVDGCVGSDYYQQCVDTYVTENPTGSSFETQVQDVLVNMASFVDRFMKQFSKGS
ncbi:hypothetical protein FisN_8Lh019 [Fistulifera solaris]|uniref:Uncharacterized protein n=1 Tax=Fistulifera solaris TaxID=1519565 RepID=A0A1Z5JD51_FISSO|nr:hypothetical protein FisN_8Lh019 [Fistulifera solaris]|eukprot:GAX11933.1 hypothetical protein FisN_8Lh019 [Fistulifera solaris]